MATTANPTTTTYASASLYAGDLSPDVAETQLYEIFNAIGPVASVRVCRDSQTRRSLGYAYVNFHRQEDAERALETLNFTQIKDRQCRLSWSSRDPTIRKSGAGNVYVKNLSTSVDNKALYDTFSIFGQIVSSKVNVDFATGQSLGYGFVQYLTQEAADKAIATASEGEGLVLAGQKVTVERFRPKSERTSSSSTRFTNIFFKNVPEDATEEELRALFAQHGVVTSFYYPDAEPKKTAAAAAAAAATEGAAEATPAVVAESAPATPAKRGFGNVNYEQPEQAAAAVERLNNFELRGKVMFVGPAQRKDQRRKQLTDHFQKVKSDQKHVGVNLFVKNLPDDITQERLHEIFQPFGQITSARVMTDEKTSKPRGFAFVCFSRPEEATAAATQLSGTQIRGKPLYVALAQPKEERRALLELQHAQRAKAMPPMPFVQPQMMYAAPGMQQRMPMYPQQQQQMLVRGNGRQQQQQQQWPARVAPALMQQQQQQMLAHQMQQQMFVHQQMLAQQQQQQQLAARVQPAALTLEDLAAQPEDAQKQIIGERLYPLIAQRDAVQAAKITGMLLEMENGELLHLLESPEALNEKIQEALSVLEENAQDE